MSAISRHASAPPQPQHQGEDVVPVAAPKTIAEAVNQMHQTGLHMDRVISRLEQLFQLQEQTPEFRAIQIPSPVNGSYTVTDQSPWIAKSIGILNPSSAAVYLGIGGSSPNLQALAPSCPASSSLVLPVEVQNLQLACEEADLGGDTAIIFLFRFVTVEPLVLRQVP